MQVSGLSWTPQDSWTWKLYACLWPGRLTFNTTKSTIIPDSVPHHLLWRKPHSPVQFAGRLYSSWTKLITW
jgi:hypothetical protein